jgi:predicted NBD/HSP70 family sugar kinase
MHALSYNERLVLDAIARNGPTPRAQLSDLVGLTGASVTRITRNLVDMGLVEDYVRRLGGKGQPSRPLQIRRGGAVAFGLNFTVSRLDVALVDLAGVLVDSVSEPLARADPATIAATARPIFEGLLARHGLAAERVAGVGVSLPGDFIERRARINAHPKFPELRDRDLVADFSEALPFPVHVENDALSAAIGERVMGQGLRFANFVYVHIGHGVGSGLILGGKPYRGANGNAGILGVQFPNDRPRPSGQDLLDNLRRGDVAVEDFHGLDPLPAGGERILRDWTKRAGGQLRVSLSHVARMIDPDAPIIGGRLPREINEAIVAEIDGPGFCDEGVMLPRPRVLASKLGAAAGMIGAGCVPLFNLYLAGEGSRDDVYLDGRRPSASASSQASPDQAAAQRL